MTVDNWPTKRLSVASLHLDEKNPRLGRETSSRAPRDIVQYLFEHDKATEVAESIANRGYFPNEPLLAINENGRTVVIEGNRRLAALKALKDPGLLEGAHERRVERLQRRITDLQTIARVPVTLAPNRRATDRQVAGRHVGTPVLAWQAENRASFILQKIEEGYENDELQDNLGFTTSDIQEARQTRAIADMARSLDLPEEVKAKLDNPRNKIFTTLGRVFDSTVGRKYLQVQPDAEHGLQGKTTKSEFIKGFKKLVSDVALKRQSSRTLNKNEDIDRYFKSWPSSDLPKKKRGSFVPSDVIVGKSAASTAKRADAKTSTTKSKQEPKTVLPKSLHVRHGGDRIVDIRRELVRLKREEFPNAGAVLLRVFFELVALDFLQRTGDLEKLIETLNKKGKLPYGVPTMRHLVPTLTRLAKARLSRADALKVEKALRYDPAAPFTLSDLHAFVHQSSDMPSARDIWQFWLRMEPFFRLMLEHDVDEVG